MGSTYYSLHYHWVCSTKERRPFISPNWRARFHEYIGGTIRGLGGTPLKIGGVEDHVHALFGLKTTHCIADFVRELKKATSAWAAENHDEDFLWQEGYSIFTVSVSMIDPVGGVHRPSRGTSSKNDFRRRAFAASGKARHQIRPETFIVIFSLFLLFFWHPFRVQGDFATHPGGLNFVPTSGYLLATLRVAPV